MFVSVIVMCLAAHAQSAGPGVLVKRFLHRADSLFDHHFNARRQLVRQKISDPDQPTRRNTLGEYLYRRVVMGQATSDRGPDQTAIALADIHDQFARGHAIGESDDSGVAVEAAIDDEA